MNDHDEHDDDTGRVVCLRAGLLLLDASLELASNLGVHRPNTFSQPPYTSNQTLTC